MEFTAELIEPLIHFIRIKGEFVVAEPIKYEREDEPDKKFLETAISGKAKYLITGNKNYFPEYELITGPAQLLKTTL